MGFKNEHKVYFLIQILSISCCQHNSPTGENDASLSSSCHNSNVTNDYSFLYQYLTGTGAHRFNDSVTIGFLGAYGQSQVVLGALPLAVDAVNNDTGTIYMFICLLTVLLVCYVCCINVWNRIKCLFL